MDEKKKEWLIYEAFRRYDIFLAAIGDIFIFAGTRFREAVKESKFPKSEVVISSRYEIDSLTRNAEIENAKQ